MWPWPLTCLLTFPMTLDFQINISQEWEGQFTWNKRDVSLIQCWIHYATLWDLKYGLSPGLLHTWYQIHWQSNGLMQHCYSFQLVGPLMGSPFCYLWAGGCCRSLNALFVKWEKMCCKKVILWLLGLFPYKKILLGNDIGYLLLTLYVLNFSERT